MNPKTKVFGLADGGYFVDYPSNRTGKNDYAKNISAVVQLANKVVPLPNKKCVADNKQNPHYCLLAEHLVKYIDTPLIVEEALYDLWQQDNILQMPCSDSYNMNDCAKDPEQMAELHKFKDYKKNLLEQTYKMSPSNRVIWAPACGFHCFPRYGEIDDPTAKKYTVPANTENSIGEVSHWFIFQNISGSYIDQVNWPMNAPCSGKAQMCKA